MGERVSQLSEWKRIRIMAISTVDRKVRAIARTLRRNPGIISRELRKYCLKAAFERKSMET